MEASVGELKRLRAMVAKLVCEDAAYRPIFERMDRMVKEAEKADAATTRARFIVRQQQDIAELIG